MAVKSKGTCMRVEIWRVNLVDEKYGQLYMTTVNDIANVFSFHNSGWINLKINPSESFVFACLILLLKIVLGFFSLVKNTLMLLDV